MKYFSVGDKDGGIHTLACRYPNDERLHVLVSRILMGGFDNRVDVIYETMCDTIRPTVLEDFKMLRLKQRCLYEKHQEYYNYGGRGIKVCESWLNFENFIKDMGHKPDPSYSLDRIDVNGDYEPGNCKWSSPIEQANNKRPRKSKSGEPGISLHSSGKWQLSVKRNGYYKYAGLYNTVEEAKLKKEELENEC